MTATIRPAAKAPAPEKKEERATTNEPKSQPAVTVGFNGNRRVPTPVNEPVRSYAPGSPERASLKARLKEMSNERIEIPAIIGGKEFRSGETAQSVMPHNHRHAELLRTDEHSAAGSIRRRLSRCGFRCLWRSRSGWRRGDSIRPQIIRRNRKCDGTAVDRR